MAHFFYIVPPYLERGNMATNEVKQWILNATLELLKNKNYYDITINEITNRAKIGRRTFYRYFKSKEEVVEVISINLIDNFAEKLLEENAESFNEIMQCYFEFWEQNIDIFLLLKSSRLLYYIEENIVELVTRIALHVGHIPNDTENATQILQEYKYEFAYKLAGFWKLTLVWSEENPRKSPTEISQIISGFMGIIR